MCNREANKVGKKRSSLLSNHEVGITPDMVGLIVPCITSVHAVSTYSFQATPLCALTCSAAMSI